MSVPNEFPRRRGRSIAIIGEAPGRVEIINRRPFMGPSGELLWSLLSLQGVQRDECYIGNILAERVSGPLDKAPPEKREAGIAVLAEDLATLRPNVVVLLGNFALRAFHSDARAKVGDWRGSVFEATGVLPGVKCVAAFHPAAVLRDFSDEPLLRFDLRKAVRESEYPEIRRRTRDYRILKTPAEVVEHFDAIRRSSSPVALDIEGGVDTMSVIAFATSADSAFAVPFARNDGSPCWTNGDLETVWEQVLAFLHDPDIPKILQNALYDDFVLSYAYGAHIVGIVEDTMLKHWEAYCELPKGLGTLASLYTDHPFYKSDRKSTDDETFYRYCCTDAALTYEISATLDKELQSPHCSPEHYRFNIGLLRPFLYSEIRGIRYDVDKARARHEEVKAEVDSTREEMEALVGGEPVNIRSQTFKPLLYQRFRLPEQTNREGRPTSDVGALLRLRYLCLQVVDWKAGRDRRPYWYKNAKHDETPWDDALAFVSIAHRHSKLRTREQMLRIAADEDGRIRCGYNIVGQVTGRTSCYTSPTGSGYNLQTIPEYDRDLILADPDHWFYQIDLTGADGWTVAAYLAALGDDTMLEDLGAGIRIPSLMSLLVDDPGIGSKPRADIALACRSVPKNARDKVMKMTQHGTNYEMSLDTMIAQIFTKSEGEIRASKRECRAAREVYLNRYWGLRRWHDESKRTLKATRRLTCASGSTRRFWNRPWDAATQREYIAHAPQHNTTYCTNLSIARQWNDPANRRGDSLIVEPLHQVHDAALGQFAQADTDFALPKIAEWFTNELVIAGINVTIPSDGGYGPSWGQLDTDL